MPEDREEYSETSDNESDYYDEENLPERISKRMVQRNNRTSVSAEAYGRFNKKKEFIPRIIKKTEEQKARIRKRLQNSFMFEALDMKERVTVIDAMDEKKVKRGEYIIHQGDDGENLYVVDYGNLDCLKRFPGDENEKFLKTYTPGESFGELALLYNSKRQASVKARTDSVLWSLDRDTFNNIVKDSAIRKRRKYEQFLSRLKLLQDMEDYERGKIADALKPLHFEPGEFIIKQGDEGNSFFFIQSGTAVALKVITFELITVHESR